MPEDHVALEVVPSPKAKPPLRTYSRRTLKRRLTTSPTRLTGSTTHTHSQSFPSTAPELNSGVDRSLGHQTAKTGRKRLRVSAPAAFGKTPTELFLEHIGSYSMLCQEKQQEEQELDLELQDGQADEVAPVVANKDGGVALDDNKPAEEEFKAVRAHEPEVSICDSQKALAAEAVKSSIEKAEDSDDDDGKKLSPAELQARTNVNIPRPSRCRC